MKNHKPFSSVKRLAASFNICPYTLYKKVREGEIPCYKFGRKILLDPDEVKATLRVDGKSNRDAA